MTQSDSNSGWAGCLAQYIPTASLREHRGSQQNTPFMATSFAVKALFDGIKIRVKRGCKRSDPSSTSQGGKQAEPLGPFLFVIFLLNLSKFRLRCSSTVAQEQESSLQGWL